MSAGNDFWPVSTPAAEKMDGQKLAAFDADLAAGKHGQVDSMLVIRHGRIVCEKFYANDYGQIYRGEAQTPSPINAHDFSSPYNYFNPWWHPYYQRGELHTLQSVTKTVTSIAIGVAMGRGEFPPLDTPVLSFLDSSRVANLDERKRRMTIRHLLTMTAGFEWAEDFPYTNRKNLCAVMEAESDWVQYAIDRPMALEPGTQFQYNSGATQLLSHIFHAATGRDIEEYAHRHLFGPLGIEKWFWKRSPTGLADTEGGLYLRPRDVAKFLQLFLKKGIWEGKPIVQPEWVRDSLEPKFPTSRGDGVHYGYKWWLYPYGKNDPRLAFGGSGLGGQRPIALPDYDVIMVFTAWNLLPGKPGLGPGDVIERVLDAVSDRS